MEAGHTEHSHEADDGPARGQVPVKLWRSVWVSRVFGSGGSKMKGSLKMQHCYDEALSPLSSCLSILKRRREK